MDQKLPMVVDHIRYPELSKVRAAKLPMMTIRDFMCWLRDKYSPSLTFSGIAIEFELYEYYNVDATKLAEEMTAMQKSRE